MAAALSTLQMFIDEYVANNIQKSDFNLRDFASKKTAIYLLLPDDRDTYHKLRKSYCTTNLHKFGRCKSQRGWRIKNKNELYTR